MIKFIDQDKAAESLRDLRLAITAIDENIERLSEDIEKPEIWFDFSGLDMNSQVIQDKIQAYIDQLKRNPYA